MIVARIATENGNYIGITAGHYGKYAIYWLDSEMKPCSTGLVFEWMWATTWGKPLEVGEWMLPEKYYKSFENPEWGFKETCYFGDFTKGEQPLVDYAIPTE
jgi:hypothetical protein